MTELEVVETEEREALEADVAHGLAELSASEVHPTEVRQSAPFEPEDVRFSDNSWLLRVVEVEDWLRLPDRLPVEASPAETAGALFRWLGVESDTFTIEDDHVVTTDRGLESLRERIDQALLNRDRFVELIDEGNSLEAATTAWIEAWEQNFDEPYGGPINAAAEVWPIGEFADMAEGRQLNLSPSYQRGDVWPTKDAQLLIESILRGIPLPSVILLRPEEDGRPYEVVDGKQRLTAILRFIGKHPKALERVRVKAEELNDPSVDLVRLFRDDYPQFRTAWKNLTGEQLTDALEREYYFPFRLRKANSTLEGGLEALAGRYFHQVRDERVPDGGRFASVEELFLRNRVSYRIPVIVYTHATPRQVHEVFELYNRQGKHLNAEEIRNAVYHSLELTRAVAFAAGDAEMTPPSLKSVDQQGDPTEQRLIQLGEDLAAYNFGTSRYRRTKVLSWLATTVLFDASNGSDQATLRSTAQQINEFFRQIEDEGSHPLRQPSKISRVLLLFADAVAAHSAAEDAWASKFKDTKNGTKWQELQLVASLAGVSLATVVLGSDIEDALLEVEGELQARTSGDPLWARPTKTQTMTQWAYIGFVALEIPKILGVSSDEVSRRLIEQFGYSGVATLEYAAKKHP